MSSHLSDEAVAAFADGVLSGHARSRAARHVDMCAECRQAVRSQRDAVLALRSAPAPSLPIGLFERLQALPSVTPVPPMPTATAPDGSLRLPTGMAAFVSARTARAAQQRAARASDEALPGEQALGERAPRHRPFS